MSFIPKAKLHLPVRRNATVDDLSVSNGNELWQTRRLIAQRIEPRDVVVLWPEITAVDFDAAGGPEWPVKKVFWDSDGIMQIELALMILDPTDKVRDAYRTKVRQGWDAEYFNSTRLLSTNEDADFDALMRSGEWTK